MRLQLVGQCRITEAHFYLVALIGYSDVMNNQFNNLLAASSLYYIIFSGVRSAACLFSPHLRLLLLPLSVYVERVCTQFIVISVVLQHNNP